MKHALALFILLSALPSVGCSRIARPPGELRASNVGECAPTPCLRITLRSLPPLPPEVSSEGSEKIRGIVEAILYTPIEESSVERSEGALVKALKALFDEQTTAGLSEAPVDWIFTRTAEVLFANSSIASIEIKSEGYIGGAHGFSDRSLLVFSSRSGTRLEWEDLISADSIPILSRIAEAEFRRVRGVAPGVKLSDAGFSFSSTDEFSLSKNFAITSAGIHLHYNPYEVAAFSYGATDILIPMEVASALFNSATVDLTSLGTSPRLVP
jgi:hypothetical protein